MLSRTTRARKLGVVLGLMGGFGLAAAHPLVANAQLKTEKVQKLKRIGPLPDLVTSVSVPAQLAQGGTATLTVKVENVFEPGAPGLTAGTAQPGSPAVSGVNLRLFFTGFHVVSIKGDSGFNCQPTGAGGTAPNRGAHCSSGAIAAGATATITVTVQERGVAELYCGPSYTDAWVDPSAAIAERSETNNRALGVTDTINCIN